MKKICATFVVIGTILSFFACSDAQKSEFTASAKGVEPIVLNLSVDKIPASSDKLYDSFKTEKIEDDFDGSYTILHFMQAGKPVMDAYLNGDAIGSIEIFSSNIGSIDGVCPGDKVQKLFDKGGKANMKNNGQLSIILGGLHFKVSGLKQAGDMKIQNAYAIGGNPQITADDFESNAEVESIVIF